MMFFKNFFILSSQIHYSSHIHFIKSGKHCCCIFCFHESAANCPAQVTHFLNFLFAAKKLFANCSARVSECIQNIVLGNFSVETSRSYFFCVYFFICQNRGSNRCCFYLFIWNRRRFFLCFLYFFFIRRFF